MKKITDYLKSFFEEFVVLLNNVPTLIVSLFILAVIGMNLLANKSINTGLDWLALDCGIIFSWLTFMTMDILTKRYGPRAATMISILALLINLILSLLFFAASKIPGVWGESFVPGNEDTINTALDKTLGGTWYIIIGSSVAFIVSAFVNNFMNWGIGKALKEKPNSFVAFATRAYISTMVGQFVDNIVFALIVSRVFFGWSYIQCVTCAASGALLELLFEIVFSPLGFKICNSLEKKKIGQGYFDYVREKRNKEVNV